MCPPSSLRSVTRRLQPLNLLVCLFLAATLARAQTPAFAKPIAHDAEFFPTTKAYLRPGDLMRATVIRGDRTAPMTTADQKWKTRIAWLDAVKMPGVEKALTFSALEDVKALIGSVPKDVRVIEYNMERGMTPESDLAHAADTVEAMAKVVRASGRKFAFGPIRAAWEGFEKQGELGRIVRACDSVAVQMQKALQANGNVASSIIEEARAFTAKVKALNPKVEVTMQLWLGRQNVEQMVAGFRAIQPHLDSAVIGTHTNPAGVLEVLKALRGPAS